VKRKIGGGLMACGGGATIDRHYLVPSATNYNKKWKARQSLAKFPLSGYVGIVPGSTCKMEAKLRHTVRPGPITH